MRKCFETFREIEPRRHSAGRLLPNFPADLPSAGTQGLSRLGFPHRHPDLVSLLETAKALARPGERSGIDSLDSSPHLFRRDELDADFLSLIEHVSPSSRAVLRADHRTDDKENQS